MAEKRFRKVRDEMELRIFDRLERPDVELKKRKEQREQERLERRVSGERQPSTASV